MGELPGVISPYVFEELKNRTPLGKPRPEALTEAMKQMAGGLPEEVGHGGGPEISAQKSSALDLCGFLMDFLYMGV